MRDNAAGGKFLYKQFYCKLFLLIGVFVNEKQFLMVIHQNPKGCANKSLKNTLCVKTQSTYYALFLSTALPRN